MIGAVSSQYLLKGYALALEQCGLLLRDAVRLYESGSYATAVVLAAFAREERGRSQILLRMWRDGSPVTVKQIEQKCGEHVAKQRAGMLSITLTANGTPVSAKSSQVDRRMLRRAKNGKTARRR